MYTYTLPFGRSNLNTTKSLINLYYHNKVVPTFEWNPHSLCESFKRSINTSLSNEMSLSTRNKHNL